MYARRLAVLLFVTLPSCAIGGDPRDLSPSRDTGPVAAQALIGAVFFDDVEFSRTDPGDPTQTAEVDLSTMPVLGVAGQMPLAGESLELGFEAGLLFSWWRADSKVVAGGSGTIVVLIDTQLVLADLFAGAYLSTIVADSLRLYLGAGPLMMWGDLDLEDETGSSSDSAFGVGGYVRGGVEYRLKDGSFLGLGVRALTSDLDFDNSAAANVDLDGLQVMLTYTQVF
jgi:hypothetical protein